MPQAAPVETSPTRWPDVHAAAVPHYSAVEHRTWATLYANQQAVLAGRACREFLDGLAAVDFPGDHIPALAEISDRIAACTGWRLLRVDGLVANDVFFAMLADRYFPSTDFIRQPEEIGYTPAPDMFHDLLGHAPLLSNDRFCAFFQRFGAAGVRAFQLGHPAVEWLPRIYWFTVEFGLIRNPDGLRIYGAGIVSSANEVLHSLSAAVQKRPFDLAVIAAQPYDIWHLQNALFVIDSFDQLEAEFDGWCAQQGLQ